MYVIIAAGWHRPCSSRVSRPPWVSTPESDEPACIKTSHPQFGFHTFLAMPQPLTPSYLPPLRDTSPPPDVHLPGLTHSPDSPPNLVVRTDSLAAALVKLDIKVPIEDLLKVIHDEDEARRAAEASLPPKRQSTTDSLPPL